MQHGSSFDQWYWECDGSHLHTGTRDCKVSVQSCQEFTNRLVLHVCISSIRCCGYCAYWHIAGIAWAVCAYVVQYAITSLSTVGEYVHMCTYCRSGILCQFYDAWRIPCGICTSHWMSHGIIIYVSHAPHPLYGICVQTIWRLSALLVVF